jgi:hypothetical protein
MNRFRRILPLCLLATCLLGGTRVRQYRLSLVTQADGTGQATGTLALEGCVPGTLVLPADLGPIKDLKLQGGPAGLRLEPGLRGVRVTLPEGVPAKCDLAFTFPVAQAFQPKPKGKTGEKGVPATSQVFRHAMVNTQETPIEDYQFEVSLPEGTMVQGIREQLPKLAKSEVGPRVRLNKTGSRQGALLKLANVGQGDDASMALEIIPARKSPLWLLVGLLLGGLYLFYFRDLVASRPA